MTGILNKVFDPNKRELKRLTKIADKLMRLLQKRKSYQMISSMEKQKNLKRVTKMAKPR